MLTNLFTHRIQIQEKTSVRGPAGPTVAWRPVRTIYARVIPLDARARAAYMQLSSSVTHKVELRKGISLSLANTRFIWKEKTLYPVGPPQELDNIIVIAVSE